MVLHLLLEVSEVPPVVQRPRVETSVGLLRSEQASVGPLRRETTSVALPRPVDSEPLPPEISVAPHPPADRSRAKPAVQLHQPAQARISLRNPRAVLVPQLHPSVAHRLIPREKPVSPTACSSRRANRKKAVLPGCSPANSAKTLPIWKTVLKIHPAKEARLVRGVVRPVLRVSVEARPLVAKAGPAALQDSAKAAPVEPPD